MHEEIGDKRSKPPDVKDDVPPAPAPNGGFAAVAQALGKESQQVQALKAAVQRTAGALKQVGRFSPGSRLPSQGGGFTPGSTRPTPV
jgi:hypothetical protein